MGESFSKDEGQDGVRTLAMQTCLSRGANSEAVRARATCLGSAWLDVCTAPIERQPQKTASASLYTVFAEGVILGRASVPKNNSCGSSSAFGSSKTNSWAIFFLCFASQSCLVV